jgi:PAS domain S-box-containing protein
MGGIVPGTDNALFVRAFDTAGHGMAIVALDGRFIKANRAFGEIVGYSPEELSSLHFQQITHPDDLAADMKRVERLIRREMQAYQIDKRYLHKKGHEVWVQLNVGTIPDERGEPQAFVSQIQDITARRRAETSMQDTIAVLAGTVELRDPYTAGHQRRVAQLGAAIARTMDLPPRQAQTIWLAGSVHDIGKVRIPTEILTRPDVLTSLEMELIKLHPQTGYELLKKIDFEWPIADITLQHHERLDGSGYPLGLKADKILLEARVIAVADVAEAMISHRPYRPSRGLEATLEELQIGSERRYDPDVVAAALAILEDPNFSFD